jgi:Zn-dependent peptidase ImmA (M78 family)
MGRAAQDRVEPEEFFPVDLNVLVQLLGWSVQQVSMVGHTGTAEPLVARCIRAEKKIVLLASLPEPVKRYTLAHELGHAVLHSEIPDCNASSRPRLLSMLSNSTRYPNAQYSEIERQAEVFARELLMPERAVRRQFSQFFGVHQLHGFSETCRGFTPQAQRDRSVDVRQVAEEIANSRGTSGSSLADFFGVSGRAMSKRLVELCLVY